ncbi:hypothetical protein GCM10023084_22410 [Streptomyces lacrimifluminis]|uniref:Uncharacterized protein n=1 Tax=Streptomyces lacrimifluminis TaxID=1500077 RepID=A0A917P1U0_9ACTN|nr:hypothetical protein GCM10012282_58070 [Streptomyces lacrimifluminis]
MTWDSGALIRYTTWRDATLPLDAVVVAGAAAGGLPHPEFPRAGRPPHRPLEPPRLDGFETRHGPRPGPALRGVGAALGTPGRASFLHIRRLAPARGAFLSVMWAATAATAR